MAESPEQSATDVTTMLEAITSGDRQAAENLLPMLYTELHKLAQARMAKLPPGQTLQPTALVHEAYMRLIGDADPGWNNRAHFFGAAAQAMRDILVERARRKARIKHGGKLQRVEFGSDFKTPTEFGQPAEDILALDEAMDRLKNDHPQQAKVVMLRYFGGLTIEDTAQVLGVTTRTIDRRWRFARAWLHKELEVSNKHTQNREGSSS